MAEAESEDGPLRSPPQEMEATPAALEQGEKRGRWARLVLFPARAEPRPRRPQVAQAGAAPRAPKRGRLTLPVVRMAPVLRLTWVPTKALDRQNCPRPCSHSLLC